LKTKKDNFISAFQQVMEILGNADGIKHSNGSSLVVMIYY
jgi:hypothetical protein